MRTLFALTLILPLAVSADWQPLWPGDAPGAPRPAAGTEEVKQGERVGNVEQPEYFLYEAPEGKRTGQGVVVLPGGGYTIVSMAKEGHSVAKWLNERGITAMVVKYRVSRDDSYGYQFPVPYLDARRAIRTMRHHAADWGVDPAKVGVMGFSAGGHLAATCATRFGDSFDEEGTDAIDKQGCRPDFAILIYPVITMQPIGHGGSRRRLLGAEAPREMLEKLSVEKQVSKETPPCFLLSTSDDGVDCRNSLWFAAACKEHGVPVSLHLFEKGGHGYGLKGKGDLAVWPELLDAWLSD